MKACLENAARLEREIARKGGGVVRTVRLGAAVKVVLQ